MRPFTLKYMSAETYYKQKQQLKHGDDQEKWEEFETMFASSVMVPDHIFQFQYKDGHYDTSVGNVNQSRNVEWCSKSYFHGTGSDNVYSILSSSLLNLSNTKMMQHGNAFGDGIYLCDDIRVARNYSKVSHRKHWPQTEILGRDMSAVFECEVNGHDQDVDRQDRYAVVRNGNCIQIRNLLIYSTAMVVKSNTTSKRVALNQPVTRPPSSESTTSPFFHVFSQYSSLFIAVLGILCGIVLSMYSRK